MLKAEQVPDEVAKAVMHCFHTRNAAKSAIAAAINAWPGMMFNGEEVIDGDVYPAIIYLVIRMETRDE